MSNGSNCDQKSQLSEILTEPLNPRDHQLRDCLGFLWLSLACAAPKK